VPARTNVAEGQDITLHVRHAELHPFNKASGRRTD
jgi:hypothetical protein